MTLRHREVGCLVPARVLGRRGWAFVPHSLPPRPAIRITPELRRLLSRAQGALDALNSLAIQVPSREWFAYAMAHLALDTAARLDHELPQPTCYYDGRHGCLTGSELELQHPYLDALRFARQAIRGGSRPISTRLLNVVHRRLLDDPEDPRGAGHLRTRQNWIREPDGDLRFVPPPARRVGSLLTSLWHALDDDQLPALIRIALAHVHFAQIHPYYNGNGRVGQLLSNVLFEYFGMVSASLVRLELGLVLHHHQQYYERLAAVDRAGDWEGWLGYFLRGVAESAHISAQAIGALRSQVERDRSSLLRRQVAPLSLALFDVLPDCPMVTPAKAAVLLGARTRLAGHAISKLVEAGILAPLERSTVLVYRRYLHILRGGRSFEFLRNWPRERQLMRDRRRLLVQHSPTTRVAHLFEMLVDRGVLTLREAATGLGVSMTAAATAIDELVAAGILIREKGARARFAYASDMVSTPPD
jgi:Fic family protein